MKIKIVTKVVIIIIIIINNNNSYESNNYDKRIRVRESRRK